jgi:hypothetical protein
MPEQVAKAMKANQHSICVCQGFKRSVPLHTQIVCKKTSIRFALGMEARRATTLGVVHDSPAERNAQKEY